MLLWSPFPPPPQARSRPRGLWKGRGTPKYTQGFDLDHDLRPAKRHRSEDSDDGSDDDDGDCYIVECSPEPSGSLSDRSDRSDMDRSDLDPETESRLEEWEDLKDLFRRAAEKYETDGVTETLSLLRSVLHTCHRFLLLYQDPSILFAEPHTAPPPSTSISAPPLPRKKCKCRESPTAFHALLGTTLFLFGNIIAQDPSLAFPTEPSAAATYWLAALDVFETGESLPSRTSGRGCEAQEDWRMAVVWGRTLLCVAEAALTLQCATPPSPPPPVLEPQWPSAAASPFAAIAMRRPPASHRIILATAVPHDLLLLAMDHFTRGIFLMPHTVPAVAPGGLPVPFSRSSELFTIAREVLAIAEQLPAAAERMRWATWADGVLQQIQVQTHVVARIRGRCWLVVGTAHVEDIEAMAETRGWGDRSAQAPELQNSGVLDSEEAEEAREGLERAVEFFERARTEVVKEQDDERRVEAEELRAFLVEGLLTLANFTKEEDKREALYQRAQLLGGDALEGMEVDNNRSY
ncbi:hypothetical protein C8F04DRAFT_72629 [Mycena alexandri]|uniref:Uncharacterized protein n=1 Tax=Mycena alexandri TaxID=1745969 RepID=A0AAD6WWK5_9AGAR|nr:hypothetical protein C8F04DRAFT_72629 [Mycena alexandri]